MSDNKQLRIVFMGTPDFSVPTLEALIQAGHSIVGVYCQPDKQKGRGKQVQMPPVKVAALEHDLPVYQPVTLRDEQVRAELEALQPEYYLLGLFDCRNMVVLMFMPLFYLVIEALRQFIMQFLMETLKRVLP